MSQNPTVLVMCLADPASNPRPNRAIHLFARQGYLVEILGFAPTRQLSCTRYWAIPTPSSAISEKLFRFCLQCLQGFFFKLGLAGKHITLLLNDARCGLLGITAHLEGRSYDLILVEDLQLLPLAFKLKGRASILFDAREFYSLQNEESLRFKLLEAPFRSYLLRNFASRCDSTITVSQGLKDAYMKAFGISMEIVRSSAFFYSISVRPTSEKFRMVHHGAAHENRGLHNMIEIVSRLDDRYTLDLYLTKNSSYVDKLRRAAGGCDRIRFRPPVSFEDIIPMLSRYDIGLFYCEPTTFNLKFCLPNKFFEFMQARLALAIGPSPEMSRLVEFYQCGFVAPEFTVDSMVATLASLTPGLIDAAKSNSDKAASELCYEKESSRLLSIAEGLISHDP